MIRHLVTLLITMFLASCGSAGQSKRTVNSGDIAQTLAEMCNSTPKYVAEHDGDSMTFTAYSRAACGNIRHLDDYSNRPGRYQRWHTELGYTWDDTNNSGTKTRARSENSKDMYLAAMALLWENRDLSRLKDIQAWGQRRGWVMGDGRFFGADTLISANLRQTLAEMIHTLGGSGGPDRYLPVVWAKCDDYECWNLGVHLNLRLDIYGRLGLLAKRALNDAVVKQPYNPLVAYVLDKSNGLGPDRALNLLKRRLSTPTGGKCDLWPYRRNAGTQPLCEDGWPGDWAYVAHTVRNHLTSGP